MQFSTKIHKENDRYRVIMFKSRIEEADCQCKMFDIYYLLIQYFLSIIYC